MNSNRVIFRGVAWFLAVIFFPACVFASDTYNITDGSGSGNSLIANGTNVIGPGATTGTLETTHGDTSHYHGVLNGNADPNPDGGADQSGWGHVSLVLPATASNPALPTNNTDTIYLTTGENPGGDNGPSSSGRNSGATYVPIDFQVMLWLAELLAAITVPGLLTAPIKAKEGSAAATLRTTATSQAQIEVDNSGTAPNISQNDLQEAAKALEKSLSAMDAADSHIRDADLAKETSEIVKGKEAEDAGKAALAQANSAPQNVLALLR